MAEPATKAPPIVCKHCDRAFKHIYASRGHWDIKPCRTVDGRKKQ